MVKRSILLVLVIFPISFSLNAQTIQIYVAPFDHDANVPAEIVELMRDSIITVLVQRQQFSVFDSQWGTTTDSLFERNDHRSQSYRLSGIVWPFPEGYSLTLFLVDVERAVITHAEVLTLESDGIERAIRSWGENVETHLRLSQSGAFAGQISSTPVSRVEILLDESAPEAAWHSYLESFADLRRESELQVRARSAYADAIFHELQREDLSWSERVRRFAEAVLLSPPHEIGRHSEIVLDSTDWLMSQRSSDLRAEMQDVSRAFRRAERSVDIVTTTSIVESESFRELERVFVEETAEIMSRQRELLWRRELDSAISLRRQDRFDAAFGRISNAEDILPGRAETVRVSTENELARNRFIERQIEESREPQWDKARVTQDTVWYATAQTSRFDDSLQRFLVSGGGFRSRAGWERLSPIAPFTRSIVGTSVTINRWAGQHNDLSYSWTSVKPNVYAGVAVGVERVELALRLSGLFGFIGGYRETTVEPAPSFTGRAGPGIGIYTEIMTHISGSRFRVGLTLDHERTIWIPSFYLTRTTSVGLTVGVRR